MNKISNILTRMAHSYQIIMKVLVFIIAIVVVIWQMPRSVKFKYEFQKMRPWQHEALYAPFNFPIYKTDEQLKQEKEEALKDFYTPKTQYIMQINPSEYKILIVDDVMSNVLLLKVLLTNEKFQIATAANGTQALQQVEKEKPDLILLDVMMPGIDGIAAAREIRSFDETAEIVFLTASPGFFSTTLSSKEDS